MRALPKRTKQHVTDDRAVALLLEAIADKGWIFRHLSADYGIDAEIEIVDSAGEATGALLRVQIKGTERETTSIQVKTTTVRYWSLSPVPVVLVHVNTGTRLVRVLILSDEELAIRNPKAEKMRIRLDEAMDLDKAWGILEDLALENRSASLDLRGYTLYNPAAQFIRWADLLLNHNGDADAMCRWMRANAPDDALTYNYGYAVFLKRQMEKDPTLIDRIRLAAFDINPGLEEAIKRKAAKRSKR